MAYQPQDRVWIRHFVGFSAIYLQAEPRLESAITATQSVADGGSRPDSSTENYVKGLIYGSAEIGESYPLGVAPGGVPQNVQFQVPFLRGLVMIERNIANLDAFMGTTKADNEAEVDTVRETKRLRSEGRRLAHALARMLGMKGVRADMFSSAPVVRDDDVFSNDNYSRDPWKANWPGPLPR